MPQVQPSSVTLDFEKAAMNAVTNSFPGTSIHGCFYHLSQSVYRHVQAAGLQERYRTDENLALAVRMLPALAFIPIDHVVEAFEKLEDLASNEIMPVIDYFEDTYIGRLRRRRQRAQPTFPVDVWNVYNNVQNSLPRTNNSVEGWNRKIQTAVSAHHPNIWRFLGILKREQSINNTHIDQLLGGHSPPAQRKKYRDNNARIMKIVREFEERETVDFLRGIAHNIAF